MFMVSFIDEEFIGWYWMHPWLAHTPFDVLLAKKSMFMHYAPYILSEWLLKFLTWNKMLRWKWKIKALQTALLILFVWFLPYEDRVCSREYVNITAILMQNTAISKCTMIQQTTMLLFYPSNQPHWDFRRYLCTYGSWVAWNLPSSSLSPVWFGGRD